MYYSDYNNTPDQPIETNFRLVPDPPKKKKRVWHKTAALCLVCALLGGLAGGGTMLLMGGTVGSTTLYASEHAPTVVSVANVTAKTPLTLPQIYATYVSSTVGITTQINTNIFGQIVSNAASGSGFVISADGYILTNYHVIKDANSIKVSFQNGDSYDATLVGGEEENDIAVLKIQASGLTPVVIGNSDNLVVGEQVAAIGNPLGELTYSLTEGVVSAKDRNITMSDGTVMNYIQTNAAINSGNSGGPMFNLYGEVVGINSAKLSGSSGGSASIEGIGFAIPINDVRDMVTDIMQYGHVTGKPYMGLRVSSVAADAQRYGTPAGAYVESVVPDACADKAGLEQGDIITAIDDTQIATSTQLISAKKSYKAGEDAALTVTRGQETLTLTITFDEETPERLAAQDEYFNKLDEQAQAQQQQEYQDKYGSGNSGGNFFFPFGW